MSKKSKSTTSNEPWKGAQPYITGGAQTLQNTYDANAGTIQSSADQITGLLPGLIEKYQQGDPGIRAAQTYNTDVLGGRYLDQGNPYLNDIIANSNNDLLNQTQAQLSLMGLTGGSDYAGIAADKLTKNSLGMRYADYGAERDRMGQAASQAPQLALADYMAINPALQAAQASTLPVSAASGYAGSLGGLLGGYQTGTQTQKPGLLGGLLGAGASLGSAAILASERHLKKDIHQVGALDDGLGVYRYRYTWDEDDAPLRTGVMVDEVKELRPWALGPVVDGIQTVDYSKLEAA